MNVVSKVALIVMAAAVLVGYLSIFTVGEHEVAVKLRFGDIVATDFEPGVHLKRPLFEEIHKFDRIMTLEEGPERLLTADRKAVSAVYFVQWRVEDVRDFYIQTSGIGESVVGHRLNPNVYNALRNEFAHRTLEEVMLAPPADWKDSIMEETRHLASQLGIRIVNFGIRQIELPDGSTVQVGE